MTSILLGEPVRCSDGRLGDLADLVLDPSSQRVTHLVVRSEEGFGRKRLIPYELIAAAGPERGVTLGCTLADAHGLTDVQEASYLDVGHASGGDPEWDVGAQDTFPISHYEAGAFVEYQPEFDPQIMQVYDRVPKGHVEIRRESTVSTADGHSAGTLAGVGFEDGRLTHLVIRHGHLWRRRSLAVPIDAVESLRTDEVIISCSKGELRRLAPPAGRGPK